MALIDQYNFWNTAITQSTMRNRAAAAAMNAARDVLNEDAGTANHALRVKWAASVFDDVNRAGADLIPFLAANATIAAAGDAATDNDIQFVVNGSINTLAAKFA